VIGPLRQARGGHAPLLATLQTYFDSGAVVTETARRLHLSPRAVSYRLARVRALTGVDPAEPRDGWRFRWRSPVAGGSNRIAPAPELVRPPGTTPLDQESPPLFPVVPAFTSSNR
jgi:hypothetical protein